MTARSKDEKIKELDWTDFVPQLGRRSERDITSYEDRIRSSCQIIIIINTAIVIPLPSSQKLSCERRNGRSYLNQTIVVHIGGIAHFMNETSDYAIGESPSISLT